MQRTILYALLLILTATSVQAQSLGGILPYSDDSDLPSNWISSPVEANVDLDYEANKLILDNIEVDLSPYGTTPRSFEFENGVISVEVHDDKNPSKEIILYFDTKGSLKANISRINENYIP